MIEVLNSPGIGKRKLLQCIENCPIVFHCVPFETNNGYQHEYVVKRLKNQHPNTNKSCNQIFQHII